MRSLFIGLEKVSFGDEIIKNDVGRFYTPH